MQAAAFFLLVKSCGIILQRSSNWVVRARPFPVTELSVSPWLVVPPGVRGARSEGLVGSLLSVGGHALGSSLGVLRSLPDLGVTAVTLAHSCPTPWWGSLLPHLYGEAHSCPISMVRPTAAPLHGEAYSCPTFMVRLTPAPPVWWGSLLPHLHSEDHSCPTCMVRLTPAHLHCEAHSCLTPLWGPLLPHSSLAPILAPLYPGSFYRATIYLPALFDNIG